MKYQFLKNISCTILFFIPNMKLECFQLSFDIHIVHTSQKFRFFPNCSTKNWKIFFVRLIDFSSILQKSYGWLDVFQRLYRWIKMPAFIWDLFYFIWMKFGDIFAKCVILIPPPYRSTKKPTLIRVKIVCIRKIMIGISNYLLCILTGQRVEKLLGFKV